MGSSLVPPASGSASIPSDNWVLMSSVTPTAGATTVTFSSLALRKKLMLVMSNFTTASSGTITITLNGDTGAKYNLIGLQLALASTTPISNIAANGLNLGTSITSGGGVLVINEADTTNIKRLSGYGRYQTPSPLNIYSEMYGDYFAAAAITSITITTASTFNAVGTMAVYGVS